MGSQRAGHDWVTFTFTYIKDSKSHCKKRTKKKKKKTFVKEKTFFFGRETKSLSSAQGSRFWDQWARLRTYGLRWSFFACSTAQSCPNLCYPMDYSLTILHHLQELAQTYVHWINDAIQPSNPLSSPSPPSFYLSKHHGLFQWVGSSYQMAKILELQLQHQSFQWIFRIDFL